MRLCKSPFLRQSGSQRNLSLADNSGVSIKDASSTAGQHSTANTFILAVIDDDAVCPTCIANPCSTDLTSSSPHSNSPEVSDPLPVGAEACPSMNIDETLLKDFLHGTMGPIVPLVSEAHVQYPVSSIILLGGTLLLHGMMLLPQ